MSATAEAARVARSFSGRVRALVDGRTEAAAALLDPDADPSLVDDHGWSALCWATDHAVFLAHRPALTGPCRRIAALPGVSADERAMAEALAAGPHHALLGDRKVAGMAGPTSPGYLYFHDEDRISRHAWNIEHALTRALEDLPTPGYPMGQQR